MMQDIDNEFLELDNLLSEVNVLTKAEDPELSDPNNMQRNVPKD